MQFTTLAIVTVTFVAGVLGNASTNIKATGPTDKGALHNCLNGYRNDNWDGMNCGGRGWFKGGSLYNNPNNCYDACANGISSAIDAGASDVQCDDHEGLGDCWMGFH